MKTILTNFFALVVLIASAFTLAENDGPPPPPHPPRHLRNDPKRPTAKIAADLGVKQEQFVTCFENVQPAAEGQRPSRDKVHANKAILLGCLQKANPTLTNETLDEVMDRYRPGGRDAQQPRD